MNLLNCEPLFHIQCVIFTALFKLKLNLMEHHVDNRRNKKKNSIKWGLLQSCCHHWQFAEIHQTLQLFEKKCIFALVADFFSVVSFVTIC